MKMLKDRGIALLTYKEAKEQTGILECNGKRIDDDTVIVYEMFYESIVETGSLATDHKIMTLWLCTANIFCKCGKYHHLFHDFPAEYQICEILENVENQYEITFTYPDKEPNGSLIVYILEMEEVKKKVVNIKDWL